LFSVELVSESNLDEKSGLLPGLAARPAPEFSLRLDGLKFRHKLAA
jgi:hypothetical protein